APMEERDSRGGVPGRAVAEHRLGQVPLRLVPLRWPRQHRARRSRGAVDPEEGADHRGHRPALWSIGHLGEEVAGPGTQVDRLEYRGGRAEMGDQLRVHPGEGTHQRQRLQSLSWHARQHLLGEKASSFSVMVAASPARARREVGKGSWLREAATMCRRGGALRHSVARKPTLSSESSISWTSSTTRTVSRVRTRDRSWARAAATASRRPEAPAPSMARRISEESPGTNRRVFSYSAWANWETAVSTDVHVCQMARSGSNTWVNSVVLP